MSAKPLQVNPIKLSQPMGATLAFLGVKECMPLMHGAQGCASFTKVFYTRHFHDPIAIQTTAVNDITAVFDGGDVGIVTAVENITKKVTPKLIGLFSTGLTETKGDDLRGAASKLTLPVVWVNTPDYEGGFESGWALSVEAMITQLVKPSSTIDSAKIAVLPHSTMKPIEVERLKEFIEGFGFTAVALPDLSTSLDGFLGEKQGQLSAGGVEVQDIMELASSMAVIAVGGSMAKAAGLLAQKNPLMKTVTVESIGGLGATDTLAKALCDLGGRPSEKIKRWRARLQDAMLDTHFILGKAKVVVAGEPDWLVGVCSALHEVGATVSVALSSVTSPVLQNVKADQTIVGDLEDVQRFVEECDMIIGNCHFERVAKKYHKSLIVRGFPDWESVGSQLFDDCLYEGGCGFLFNAANTLESHRAHG